jgi:hypothetical protein
MTDIATSTSLPVTSTPRTLRNHVAGAWQEVDAVETLTDLDPATGQVLAAVPLSGASGARSRRRSVPAT